MRLDPLQQPPFVVVAVEPEMKDDVTCVAGAEPGQYTVRTFAGASATERAIEVAAPRTELALGGR